MANEAELPDVDVDLIRVLEDLLASDQNITARAVARLHPRISAASSVTRSVERTRILKEYQERQAAFRKWRGRPSRLSKAAAADALAQRDLRIAHLEAQVALLTASHLAMIRAVGEVGGFKKWASFYEPYSEIRNRVAEMGGLPDALVAPLPSRRPK